MTVTQLQGVITALVALSTALGAVALKLFHGFKLTLTNVDNAVNHGRLERMDALLESMAKQLDRLVDGTEEIRRDLDTHMGEFAEFKRTTSKPQAAPRARKATTTTRKRASG